MTHTPPSGSPGGYPRHSSDWSGTSSPQYGSGGVHYPSEVPGDRGSDGGQREGTAGDKWVDRRLDKFGRLMGMRDRTDPDPLHGQAQPPAGPAAEPVTLAQQPAAAQPAPGLTEQPAGSQQVLPQPPEARAPMYADPGQTYAEPAPSYSEPGPGYAELAHSYPEAGQSPPEPAPVPPAPPAYQAPVYQASAGGAGPYPPGPQQAQHLASGTHGDRARPAPPAGSPLAAGPPTHAGGIPAASYGSQPAGAGGPDYPSRGYSFPGSAAPGPAQGYAPAPDRVAQEQAQGYSPPAHGAPAYGAQEYRPQEYGSGEYGSREYGSREYGSAAYGAEAQGTQPYTAQAYRTQAYPAQGPETQAYPAQGPETQAYPAQAQGTQPYGARSSDAQGYGTQSYGRPEYANPYGTQDYATQRFGSPGYPARHYPPPAEAGPDRGPVPGYAPASSAPPGYAAPAQAGQRSSGGYAGRDYGPPAATENRPRPGADPAGLSWEQAAVALRPDAYSRPVPPAPAGGSLATRPDTPSALAEPSAEPLYRVLGGLALRDLTLVESLLEIVEELESREEDPQQLDSLFRVDHLATRMRRNSENLLVLAGQDRESRDFEPVSLLDVARAAVSEIADYDRAQVAQLPGVQLVGLAADDVTHILAELLDNAMSKSPASAEVVIRGERTGDATLIVSVEDSGIGIPADRLNEINLRLSRPPVVDVAVTRHMGLYVVGRLAHRHGIRVQLRERPYGGIVASVIIPAHLVGNDPDAPREIRPAEPGGRYQPSGGLRPQAPQLSIEARGADGLRAQRMGGQDYGPPFSGTRGGAMPEAATGPGPGGADEGPGAQSGTGWPAGSRQPARAAQEPRLERPAPAPAAGYLDAVPVPKFEPADPSELPKRKPGALSAVNGIPAPEVRRERVPTSAAEESAVQSEADRIRSELSEFQSGQRAALSDAPGPGGVQGDYRVGTDADQGSGEPAGGVADEAGENDGV